MPILLLLTLLVAPPVPDPVLSALQAADSRVAAVGWRLQTANVALCPDHATVSGLSVHALSQYSRALRPQARVQFALGERPGVAAVVAGSAAERAGLKAGDALLSINGIETPTSADGKPDYAAVAVTEGLLETALARGSVQVRVGRDGSEHMLTLRGDPGCRSRVQIVPGRELNAEADGQYVQISSAMLDEAVRDDELAVIVAHEMAHNILGHRARLDSEKVSRGLFAGLGRNGARLRATEFEADRLGIWLMARAGFDVAVAVPFWRRLARKSTDGILSDGTHPAWRDRLSRVATAVAQVEAQKREGRPLLPPAQ